MLALLTNQGSGPAFLMSFKFLIFDFNSDILEKKVLNKLSYKVCLCASFTLLQSIELPVWVNSLFY